MSKKLLVLVSLVAMMTSSCAIFICESDPFESDEDSRDTIQIIVKEDQNNHNKTDQFNGL